MNKRLVFSNTKKSNDLRQLLWVLIGMIIVETVVVGIIVYLLLPQSWILVLTLTLVIGLPVFILNLIRKILNSRHVIMLDTLKVSLSLSNFIIPLSKISEVKYLEHTSIPDSDALGLSIFRNNDALYVLSRNSDIIQISLNTPILVRAKALGGYYGKQGLVEKLFFNVDEPINFLTELRERTGLDSGEMRGFETATISQSIPIHNPSKLDNSTVSIEFRNLHKFYGDYAAVNNLNFDVHEGEIFGFLGVNGAGKSTTIKMMTGLLRPAEGQILVQGKDLWQSGSQVRRCIGYIPDTPLVYERLTGREMLTVAGQLYGLSEERISSKSEELLSILSLQEWSDHLISTYSMGMQRKISVALALLPEPEVIIVDELTNAFDTPTLAEIKSILMDLRNQGKTVFLSTHVMDVAEKLCDRIGIIHRGKLVAVGTVKEVSESLGVDDSLESLFLHLIGSEGRGGKGV